MELEAILEGNEAVGKNKKSKTGTERVFRQMKKLRRGIFGFLLVFGLGITGYSTAHGQVIEGSLVVTDVTPVQFCVIWGTREPATGWVSVFLDSEGANPWAGAVVKSESSEHPPAETIGVMKVKVMGLKPDTEYFFRTQTTMKKNSDVYESPVIRVRTEKSSVIVRNDVLVQKVNIGETNPAPGILVIASVAGASYPVSAWVGDGVPEEWAAIDTNNFYNSQTHFNLELKGGEVITLKVFGGALGSVEMAETIPEESGGMQRLSRAASLTSAGYSVPESPAGPTGASGGGGGGCFISAAME
jgi:hypothetical protein